MSVLVVGAAPLEGCDGFYRELLTGADRVVAADAGGEWCASLGRVPALVVGDFDSARPGAIDRLRALGSEVLGVPADKDETDLELAVGAALERFGGPVTVTCAFTLRMDHTLAAFGALLAAGPGAQACEPGWRAWVTCPGAPLSLSLGGGRRFSLVSPCGARGVSVTGARWVLEDADLSALSGRGISNVAGPDRVEVSCREGAVLVMLSDQA